MRPASIFDRSRMSLIKASRCGPRRARDRAARCPAPTPRGILPQHLGDADDGVERRAQLVAHAGEELRLVLAGLGELLALVLDFVEQPHVLDRDHRLVGEGLEQVDPLVGERPGLARGPSARRWLSLANYWKLPEWCEAISSVACPMEV